jgi:lauroyl/myristoyl acyltransferase
MIINMRNLDKRFVVNYRLSSMSSLARIGCFLVSALARSLPRRVSYLIGETAGGACFLLCPARRRRLLSNLRVVTGPQGGRVKTRLAFAVMINFARSVVDTFLVPYMDSAYLARHVRMTDRAGLASLAGRGKGIILVTAHLGSWEMGGFALARKGYKITTVAGVQFSWSLSPIVKALKAGYGIAVTSPAGSLAILRALKRGEVVALHLDGDQYSRGIETAFFGQPAAMPRGPAALALRTGAALVPAFAVRTSRDSIHIFIEDAVPTLGQDEAGLTQRLAAVVEDVVRRHPDQWCMFRPIWGPAR